MAGACLCIRRKLAKLSTVEIVTRAVVVEPGNRNKTAQQATAKVGLGKLECKVRPSDALNTKSEAACLSG